MFVFQTSRPCLRVIRPSSLGDESGGGRTQFIEQMLKQCRALQSLVNGECGHEFSRLRIHTLVM